MKTKIILYSLIGGAIITLLTGVIPNNPSKLIGATRYGYPFSWLIKRIVAPQYFPWRLDLINLIVDIMIWSVIIGLILFLLTYFRSRS